MAANNLLTVRLPETDIKGLDELAAARGTSRSQVVQQALHELVKSSRETRQREMLRVRKRLSKAVKDQCELLDSNSISDEYRRF